MTIVQMQYFSTVCESMDLLHAAQQLHITRPALVKGLEELEAACDVVLLQYHGDAVSLTDEGAVFLQEARSVLRQYEHLEEMVSMNHLRKDEVRIGVSPIPAAGLLPDIVAAFRREHPQIRLHLIEKETSRLYQMLDVGLVDLIIAVPQKTTSDEQDTRSDVYEALPLWDADLMFGVDCEHPLAEQTDVVWADIISEPLTLPDLSSDLTQFITAKMAQNGYDLPTDTCLTTQLSTSILLIESGAAVGFLPADVVQRHPQIKGLTFPGSKGLSFCLVYRRDRHLFSAVGALIDAAMAWKNAHCAIF